MAFEELYAYITNQISGLYIELNALISRNYISLTKSIVSSRNYLDTKIGERILWVVKQYDKAINILKLYINSVIGYIDSRIKVIVDWTNGRIHNASIWTINTANANANRIFNTGITAFKDYLEGQVTIFIDGFNESGKGGD